MIDFSLEGGEDIVMIILALLCSLMSIGFFIYLAIQHVELILGVHAGQSVCNINQHFNCDSVSLSRFSEMFGIPIAIWGAWAQFVILLLLLIHLTGLATDKDRVLRGAGWGSLLVSITSIVMLGISHFAVKSYCLFCMGTYILSWIQTAAIWKQSRFTANLGEDLPHFFKDKKWIPITAVLVLVGGSLLSHAMMDQNYDVDKMAPYVSQAVESWNSSKVSDFNLEKGLTLTNTPNGNPVMTVVEFADFECPHCKLAYPSVEAFVESHEGVKLVFKFFPLDGNCNADKAPKGDGSRCVLAKAVYCAQSLTKDGWPLHHFIFDHQEEFYRSPEIMPLIKDKVAEMGIDEKALQTCIDADSTHEAIIGMTEEALSAGVDGTPAIFVNGKKIGIGPLFPILDQIYKGVKN